MIVGLVDERGFMLIMLCGQSNISNIVPGGLSKGFLVKRFITLKSHISVQ